MKKIARQVKPVSPGEMLEEEFLKPLGLWAPNTAAHFHAIANATVYSCGAMVRKASTRTSMSEAGLRAPVFSEAVRSRGRCSNARCRPSPPPTLEKMSRSALEYSGR